MSGPLWVTVDADVRCDHVVGKIGVISTQDLLRVEGRPVVVGEDPVGRPIGGCPNTGVSIKPCNLTLRIQVGRSTFVTIDGRPVIRADLSGFTDGTPPMSVRYTVRDPGQRLVAEQP